MRAVFVDLGETLVHFKPRYHENVLIALKDYGYEVDEAKLFRAINRILGRHHYPSPEYGGLSSLDFAELFYELKIYPDRTVIKELNSKNLLSGEYQLYDDAIPFLEGVKSLGLKIVLISNATRSLYRIIEDLGIKKYFDGIVASCDLNIMKPHPKIFSYAVKLAGGDGIHIGDVYEIDVLGAKRAGLEALLIDRQNFYSEIKEKRVNNLLEALELVKERSKSYYKS
ncbi:2-haloalkanoic acid dehalogenase [Sulfolobus sp. A20]|uniref:HAD family hydrolase n=1 Tax=Saccharolobus sp. A20 TaxID=1891280 RepID=UPI000845E27C|nr:HAD-IA family hydrolase [Sulfolobus sp. A20]TRM74054.1 2-haloalkanoic acid dehalogenase [Sulfolobus sp. E5]TRM77986.1 2-haloalkanoic acid dehalogenase [Sulfolobus sp. A20-N-F8]TRM78050.1 2-haloalkanoic acid dehalogenase [Sulfolobus sp. B5]TRM81277.1 2-haloalkanoic acid dehalogenase [Sulfolobus sp. D5]TRM84218.1 2-haloalkanoic acid dehalogenase [Sulfolobus sp. F3]TRM88359.1 2-haloalkanoic acid dehalogenase [Sulfolobus sp. E3]TRM93708.1 2-haloalkanoic acid dehalogenase [Sulfolobus sp. A20-N